jgi:hypothetical protein
MIVKNSVAPKFSSVAINTNAYCKKSKERQTLIYEILICAIEF